MTSTPHHLASMSSDEPRGYGAVGDARKRLTHPLPHHDPAVVELMARAWDEGNDAAYQFERGDFYPAKTNPYRSAS